MKYWVTCAVLAGVLIGSPVSAAAQTTSTPSRAELLETIAELQQLIATLTAQVAAQAEVVRSTPDLEFETYLSDDVEILARYERDRAGEMQLQGGAAAQYWREVERIFPERYADQIAEFAVFSPNDITVDAYVETIAPTHLTWRLLVSDEMLPLVGDSGNTDLLVHELAHLVSYDHPIGVPRARRGSSGCAVFRADMCPPHDTYLRSFADRFWSDDNRSAAARYRRAPEDFVTEYAAQNPGEDFAETFMFYVMGYAAPTGAAREKVAFIAQMPIAQHLRSQFGER